jgi:hypothetical protein
MIWRQQFGSSIDTLNGQMFHQNQLAVAINVPGPSVGYGSCHKQASHRLFFNWAVTSK